MEKNKKEVNSIYERKQCDIYMTRGGATSASFSATDGEFVTKLWLTVFFSSSIYFASVTFLHNSFNSILGTRTVILIKIGSEIKPIIIILFIWYFYCPKFYMPNSLQFIHCVFNLPVKFVLLILIVCVTFNLPILMFLFIFACALGKTLGFCKNSPRKHFYKNILCNNMYI